MTATMTPHPVAQARPTVPARARDRFYLAAALVMLVVVFAGFAPTFFLREAFGGPELPWWLVWHGVGQTAWFAALAAQAALVHSRRVSWHRWLGWATVAIAVLTIATTPVVILRSVPRGLAIGLTAIEVSFVVMVNVLRLPFFTAMLGLAVWKRRQRETHARALLLASLSNFTPAFTRLGKQLGVGPLTGAVLLVVVCAVAMVVHDRRALGRVHPVTRGGIIALALMLVIPIGIVMAGGATPIVEALR